MASEKKPVAKADTIECAVLCDSIYGKHDDIIELDAATAHAAKAAGWVDTHPGAIKAIRDAAVAKAAATKS